jgi:hypothetical protein
MVYMFMTGAGFDEDARETWDPDLGENAVVVQPGSFDGPSTAAAQGPTVGHLHFDTPGVDRLGPAEFLIATEPRAEHPFIAEAEVDAMDPTDQERILESWRGTKSGGSPYMLQAERYPFSNGVLVFQSDEAALPIAVNFGLGIGYCFANEALSQGKLLWQS